MEEFCGQIELDSGAVCGLEAGHRTVHADRTHDGIEIHWKDEDHIVPLYSQYRSPTAGYWQPVR